MKIIINNDCFLKRYQHGLGLVLDLFIFVVAVKKNIPPCMFYVFLQLAAKLV